MKEYNRRNFLKTSTKNVATGLAALVTGVYVSKNLYKPESLEEKYSGDCCCPDICRPDVCMPDKGGCRPVL